VKKINKPAPAVERLDCLSQIRVKIQYKQTEEYHGGQQLDEKVAN
jgi:hypothetical protein